MYVLHICVKEWRGLESLTSLVFKANRWFARYCSWPIGTQSEQDLIPYVEYQLQHDQLAWGKDGLATIRQATMSDYDHFVLISLCIVAGSLRFKFTVRTPHWGLGRCRSSNSSIELIRSKWIKWYNAWSECDNFLYFSPVVLHEELYTMMCFFTRMIPYDPWLVALFRGIRTSLLFVTDWQQQYVLKGTMV